MGSEKNGLKLVPMRERLTNEVHYSLLARNFSPIVAASPSRCLSLFFTPPLSEITAVIDSASARRRCAADAVRRRSNGSSDHSSNNDQNQQDGNWLNGLESASA